MEIGCQPHAPAALFPGREIPVPTGVLGGPQSRSGRFGEKNRLPVPGYEPQIVKPSHPYTD
jgi:hypothetical protein